MRAMACAAAALISLLPLDPAQAGGFLVSKIGGDRAGPVSAEPSAIFWNPGALGLIEGTRLMLDANLITRQATYTRAVGGRYGGQAELTDFNAQPALFAVSDLGLEDWSFGLGVHAPFGSGSAWDDPAGPQRHHAIWGGITSVFVTPTASYRIADGLHVGASLSYVRASVTSYRAIDFGAEIAEVTGGDVPAEQPGNEGRALLDFSGHAAAWSLGMTWQTGPVVLGASYASAVQILLPGELSLYVPRNDFFRGLTISRPFCPCRAGRDDPLPAGPMVRAPAARPVPRRARRRRGGPSRRPRRPSARRAGVEAPPDLRIARDG